MTHVFVVAARSAWRKISPARGASRASPRCGRKIAFEYGHSFRRAFWRSRPSASCCSIGYPSAIWMAGSSTSLRLSLPHSASITMRPAGVPGVTAPVIGPRTLTQLEDLLGATDLELDNAERARLAEPAPPPDVPPDAAGAVA